MQSHTKLDETLVGFDTRPWWYVLLDLGPISQNSLHLSLAAREAIMASDAMEMNTKVPTKLFGLIGRKIKRAGKDPLVVTEETTAWEIYNDRADEIDRELVKDWNDSLHTLLIFVRKTTFYSTLASNMVYLGDLVVGHSDSVRCRKYQAFE
jgi:hypothetical protein